MKSIEERMMNYDNKVYGLFEPYGLVARGVFEGFDELKFRWDYVSFKKYLTVHAPDYLIDAPDDVLLNITFVAINNCVLSEHDITYDKINYSPASIEWMLNELPKKKDLYIKRHKMRYDDRLDERMECLKKENLIDDRYFATKKSATSYDNIVKYSTLFGVLSFPESILKYDDATIDFVACAMSKYVDLCGSSFSVNHDVPKTKKEVALEVWKTFKYHQYDGISACNLMDVNEVIDKFIGEY